MSTAIVVKYPLAIFGHRNSRLFLTIAPPKQMPPGMYEELDDEGMEEGNRDGDSKTSSVDCEFGPALTAGDLNNSDPITYHDEVYLHSLSGLWEISFFFFFFFLFLCASSSF